MLDRSGVEGTDWSDGQIPLYRYTDCVVTFFGTTKSPSTGMGHEKERTAWCVLIKAFYLIGVRCP